EHAAGVLSVLQVLRSGLDDAQLVDAGQPEAWATIAPFELTDQADVAVVEAIGSGALGHLDNVNAQPDPEGVEQAHLLTLVRGVARRAIAQPFAAPQQPAATDRHTPRGPGHPLRAFVDPGMREEGAGLTPAVPISRNRPALPPSVVSLRRSPAALCPDT